MSVKCKKILHVGEYVNGGVATYLKTITNTDDVNSSFEQYVVMSNFKSIHDLKIPPEHIFYYKYKRSLLGVISAIYQIYKVIMMLKPDIIYCHSTWAGLFVRLPRFVIKYKSKIIYNAHGWSFLMDVSKYKKLIYGCIEKILSYKTDVIINVSKNEYNEALHYMIPKYKMVVIYNGISRIIRKGSIDCFDKNKINVLFVGRLDRQKGFDILKEQFDKIKRNDICLHVVGGHVVDDEIRVEFKNKNVVMHGWVRHEDLSNYYYSSDVVIMPSRWEAFGLVAIESMKYGRPLIVSNKGALPELVHNGENGYIFDIENPAELYNILINLGKKSLHDMRDKSRTEYLKKYTKEKMMVKLYDIYEKLT